MNHYIAIEDSNWADEFDLQGMSLHKSDKKIREFKKEFFDNIEKERRDDEKGIYPISFYFGTNEEVEIESREELEEAITFKTIKEEEYKIIKKVLGNNFGLSAII